MAVERSAEVMSEEVPRCGEEWGRGSTARAGGGQGQRSRSCAHRASRAHLAVAVCGRGEESEQLTAPHPDSEAPASRAERRPVSPLRRGQFDQFSRCTVSYNTALSCTTGYGERESSSAGRSRPCARRPSTPRPPRRLVRRALEPARAARSSSSCHHRRPAPSSHRSRSPRRQRLGRRRRRRRSCRARARRSTGWRASRGGAPSECRTGGSRPPG